MGPVPYYPLLVAWVHHRLGSRSKTLFAKDLADENQFYQLNTLDSERRGINSEAVLIQV
jgi:hypothetical protein